MLASEALKSVKLCSRVKRERHIQPVEQGKIRALQTWHEIQFSQRSLNRLKFLLFLCRWTNDQD